jgi:hypothetical protein
VFVGDIAFGVDEAVVVLNQEPFVLGASSLHQRPGSPEPAAAEEDRELSFREPFAHPPVRFTAAIEGEFASLVRRVRPGVPDDDLARAVFAFGDDALERCVVHRVVLDHDGQALVLRIERGALWDGPGLEDAVDLQAKVVVQPRRSVLLDDERQRTAVVGAVARRRLWCAFKVALLAVFVEHLRFNYSTGEPIG